MAPLPFVHIDLKRRNIFQKLLKAEPKINALIEVNNALAEVKDIKELSIEDILKIAEIYGINIQKKFSNEIQKLYGDYLEFCLVDKYISDEEEGNLKHLKSVLGLNDSAINKVHDTVITAFYKASVSEVIADGKVDESERIFLQKIQSNLKLPDETATKIYSSLATAYLQKMFDNAVADRQLSPEEEKEIEEIANNLGINIEYDAKTEANLAKCRYYWVIENGDLPAVNVPINLHRNEKCVFTSDFKWYENRRVTKSVRYAGPTARIKFGPGLYWRMGDLAVQRVSEDVLTQIDAGRFYLTNKRLILTGSRKNSTIRLSAIIDFEGFKNGISILKESGRSPFLEFNNNVDICGMILNRVLRDSE